MDFGSLSLGVCSDRWLLQAFAVKLSRANSVALSWHSQSLLCGAHCLVTPKANKNSRRHKAEIKSEPSKEAARGVRGQRFPCRTHQ